MNRHTKRFLRASLLLVFLISSQPMYGYKIQYAEQYYRLYHQHLYQYPEDYQENIWYLERALRSPFVNPLNALATIETEAEWERYRTLFYLHLNLELVKQFRGLGSKYDKRQAYFYNYPWKSANLDSLNSAEECYNTALAYWQEALNWWSKAEQLPYLHLDEIEEWEDERYRISQGELDFGEFIYRDLDRLAKVRKTFKEMDENTY